MKQKLSILNINITNEIGEKQMRKYLDAYIVHETKDMSKEQWLEARSQELVEVMQQVYLDLTHIKAQ